MATLEPEEMTKRAAVLRDITPFLSGITTCLTFPNHHEAQLAITKLSSCADHQGTHHFAVIGGGKTVCMSDTGVDCIAFLLT